MNQHWTCRSAPDCVLVGATSLLLRMALSSSFGHLVVILMIWRSRWRICPICQHWFEARLQEGQLATDVAGGAGC